ncbi:MAG: hypothetical protein CMJ89_10080 [Planctomycetes bacterium]|nr:hypothetical protein [Planctomycetota bacterium]
MHFRQESFNAVEKGRSTLCRRRSLSIDPPPRESGIQTPAVGTPEPENLVDVSVGEGGGCP